MAEGARGMEILYIYLALINLVAFVLMGIDKYKATRHRWRIPERTLFLTAVLGGSLGALLGMWIFWHKTRKKVFAVGMPVLLILQLLVVFYISSRLA